MGSQGHGGRNEAENEKGGSKEPPFRLGKVRFVKSRKARSAVATTVESASAMEATAAVVTDVAMEAATMVATAHIAMAVVAAMPIIAMAIITAAPTVMPPPTAAVIAVVPRASADKDAVHKPVRAIVAGRRTSVRIVAVVAISTDRRGTNRDSDRANANADSHTDLRVSAASGGEEQNSK